MKWKCSTTLSRESGCRFLRMSMQYHRGKKQNQGKNGREEKKEPQRTGILRGSGRFWHLFRNTIWRKLLWRTLQARYIYAEVNAAGFSKTICRDLCLTICCIIVLKKACRFLGNIICLSRRRQNGPDFPVRNILPRYSGNRWDALQVFTEAAGRRKIRILFKQFLYAGSQFFAFAVSKEQLLEMFAGQGTFYQFQVQFF